MGRGQVEEPTSHDWVSRWRWGAWRIWGARLRGVQTDKEGVPTGQRDSPDGLLFVRLGCSSVAELLSSMHKTLHKILSSGEKKLRVR